MTINSKRNITSMIAGIAVVAAYLIFIRADNAPAMDDIAAWAKLILIFIGIGVAMQIVIQILFHIVYTIGIAVKEHDLGGEKTIKFMRASMFEDERDKLITLKALRIGYRCAGFGLLAALVTLAAGAAFVVVLHIAVGAAAFALLIEGCAGVFYHERGVRNG